MTLFLISVLGWISTARAQYGCADPTVFENNNQDLKEQLLNGAKPAKHIFLHQLMNISAYPVKGSPNGVVKHLKKNYKNLVIKKITCADDKLEFLIKDEVEFVKVLCGQDLNAKLVSFVNCESEVIPSFYGCVEHEKTVYLYQEKLDMDFSNQELLGAYNNLSGQEKAKIMLDIISKFKFIHSKNIVHGDIKPANIMVKGTDFKDIRIIDFGFSNYNTNYTYGVPTYYISPELEKSSRLTFAEDVYSLAITFAMMEHSMHNYIAKNMDAACFSPIEQAPSNCEKKFLEGILSAFNKASGTKDLSTVIAKAIHKTPSNRYQSMDEFEKAIKGVQSSLSNIKPKNIPKPNTVWAFIKRVLRIDGPGRRILNANINI